MTTDSEPPNRSGNIQGPPEAKAEQNDLSPGESFLEALSSGSPSSTTRSMSRPEVLPELTPDDTVLGDLNGLVNLISESNVVPYDDKDETSCDENGIKALPPPFEDDELGVSISLFLAALELKAREICLIDENDDSFDDDSSFDSLLYYRRKGYLD